MDYAPIMPAFIRFPNEAAIIGRMLAGYGELEFLVCLCLQTAFDGDLNKATRLMFRSRSEEHRISTADAILRPFYEAQSLADQWEIARRAVYWCKSTRNQFAHCHWLDGGDSGLFFTNLEKGAKTKSGVVTLAFFHVDVPLLERQEAHFRDAGSALIYLDAEHKRRSGKLRNHAYKAPLEIAPPPRHNPPSEHPIRSVFADTRMPPRTASSGS